MATIREQIEAGRGKPLTLWELVQNGRGKVDCPRCAGVGRLFGLNGDNRRAFVYCAFCKGEGLAVACGACDGSGACSACEGRAVYGSHKEMRLAQGYDN